MENRKCLYCGKLFIAKGSNAKWCSKKCKDIVYRISKGISVNANTVPYIKICSECGEKFETFRDTEKTCSHKCALERRKRSNRTQNVPVTKKCVVCGTLFNTFHSVQATCGDDDCKNKYRKIRHAERNAKSNEIKKIERRFYNASHTEERTCSICGAFFYCLKEESRKTCSSECSKEYARKKQKRHHDKRLEKYNISEDRIDLKTLYKRDKGICYLCGKECDWNDHEWKDGIHYTGDNYPSRDHVVPLALGGEHIWENVRLAHMKCNMKKGVTTQDYTKTMALEDARKYAIERSQNKKKTAQYTLDGELIKIWDSTAQIKRELGLNDKHIQNVCRLRDTKTGNAYGFHWEYVV